MSLIDDYLGEAGDGAVIMAAPTALDDLRANTPADQWRDMATHFTYRGARVELHDEWSWGWMVRRADGSMVEKDAPKVGNPRVSV